MSGQILKPFREYWSRLKKESRSGIRRDASTLATEAMGMIASLRYLSEASAIDALRAGIDGLEAASDVFGEVPDPRGLLSGPVNALADLCSDLFCETAGDAARGPRRRRLFHRLLVLWISDETGFLSRLDDTLLEAATEQADEETVASLARDVLRMLPIPLPPPRGARWDIHRLLLYQDRYRLQRLLGELEARRGSFVTLLATSENFARTMGDAVDFVRDLIRSGHEDAAFAEVQRRLKDPGASRRQVLELLQQDLASRSLGDVISIAAARERFVRELSIEAFDQLIQVLPPKRRQKTCIEILGQVETSGAAPELCFELYLDEGFLLEADGMVTTRVLDPIVLVEAARRIMDEHPRMAAGWLLIATYRRVQGRVDPRAYRDAALWLSWVRRAAELTGQQRGFSVAIEEFKTRHRGAVDLMNVLLEHGL